jgi:hypothetical protein
MRKKYDIEDHFLSGITTIYDDIIGKGINLIYVGRFNHNIIKMFSAMAEADMKKKAVDNITKRRVYHAMIEILQNMSRHSDEISESTHVGKGLFMIGKKGGNYFIISSNKVKNKNISNLKEAIQRINKASFEELNEMYTKQLSGGKISKKGGAGLGLIDISRKTSKALQYNFIRINTYYSYFVLKVVIDKKKIK